MKIISHRGNLNGPNSAVENHPESITKAISLGFDVEIDVWLQYGRLFAGHDEPEFLLDDSFIRSIQGKSWLHCKNFEALDYLINYEQKLNYFWHENDSYTITSFGYIWAYPGKIVNNKSIAVLPELVNPDISNIFGICTDYPLKDWQYK